MCVTVPEHYTHTNLDNPLIQSSLFYLCRTFIWKLWAILLQSLVKLPQLFDSHLLTVPWNVTFERKDGDRKSHNISLLPLGIHCPNEIIPLVLLHEMQSLRKIISVWFYWIPPAPNYNQCGIFIIRKLNLIQLPFHLPIGGKHNTQEIVICFLASLVPIFSSFVSCSVDLLPGCLVTSCRSLSTSLYLFRCFSSWYHSYFQSAGIISLSWNPERVFSPHFLLVLCFCQVVN